MSSFPLTTNGNTISSRTAASSQAGTAGYYQQQVSAQSAMYNAANHASQTQMAQQQMQVQQAALPMSTNAPQVWQQHQVVDPSSGNTYMCWQNPYTGETTWNQPPPLIANATPIRYSGTISLLPSSYNQCVGSLPDGYVLAIVPDPQGGQQQQAGAQTSPNATHLAVQNPPTTTVTPAANNGQQAATAATSIEQEPKRARYDRNVTAIDLTGPDSEDEDENDVDGAPGNDSDDISEASSTHYDWEDPCWDHHFGMDHENAGGPYGNRGRTEDVWKVLEHYGFKKANMEEVKKKKKGEKSKIFQDKTPDACFEKFVRGLCKKGVLDPVLADVETGEINGCSISSMARKIKSSHLMEYIDDDEKKEIAEMSDLNIVRNALSTDGLLESKGYFYSFCWNRLEDGGRVWHCRLCGDCKGWREWHCKGCNTCKYGTSIPCDKCSPKEFENWERSTGY